MEQMRRTEPGGWGGKRGDTEETSTREKSNKARSPRKIPRNHQFLGKAEAGGAKKLGRQKKLPKH